ncbi:MAG TPA: hypothetical protein VEK15_21870 [Vicinamibacteria bacterium]|nr:hypothetical protein [Vicinamibacteria bacterium]
MARARRLWIAVGIVFLSALASYLTEPGSIRLTSDSFGWRTSVRGGAPRSASSLRSVVRLPGVNRLRPGRLLLQWSSGNVSSSVSIDGGPSYMVRSSREGAIALALPPAPSPGVRLDLVSFARQPGARPARLVSISVENPREKLSFARALGSLLAGVLVLVLLGRVGPELAISMGLFAAGLSSLVAQSALVYLTVPEVSGMARLAIPSGLMVAGWVSAGKDRRRFVWGATLLSAMVFGVWVRLFFLPSPGSWDTEYWKAWTARANAHGVTRVYGDADTIPRGQFWHQLRNPQEAWTVSHRGREFGVDYPPLAMALWRASSLLVSRILPEMDAGERENVAAKLPAFLGDVAAAGLLLWAFRRNLRWGLVLSACYWALPSSWLSSAVLGFQDGAYAPLAAAGLLAAGSGLAAASGGLLALAFWVKPLALVVFPVAAIGLLARDDSRSFIAKLEGLIPAMVAGLAITGAILVPFALAGTLEELLVHMVHAFRPGNLSSGFANPWWILGHLMTVAKGDAAITDRVDFVRLDTASLPAAQLGTALVAISTLWILWRRRNRFAPEALASTAAAVFFAFAMLSTGVYENHPHLVYLLLLFGGLPTSRMRFLAGTATLAYVLNLLVFSGLGRFYGNRYMLLEPMVDALSGLRLTPGFDLTLALALVHVFILLAILKSSWK